MPVSQRFYHSPFIPHKHNKAADSNRLSIDKLRAGQYNSGIKFEFDEQEAENMYKHPNCSVIASICAEYL